MPWEEPGDLIMLSAAARVSSGKLVLWEAFGAITVAMVAGALVCAGGPVPLAALGAVQF